MTAAKLHDAVSTTQSSYYARQGMSQYVKFAENTACK